MNANFRKTIIAALITVTFLAQTSGMTWLSIVLGLLVWSLMFSGWLNHSTKDERHRRQAAKQAFEELDVIGLGKRWQGKAAEVALVNELTDIRNTAPWKVQVLARTPANAWFITEMQVEGITTVSIQQLHHINEDVAKELLGQEPKIYERFFDMTNTAQGTKT